MSATKDYRKAVWMVQSRDSDAQIAEYKAAGIDAAPEWTDRLKKPVTGPRALYLAGSP